MFQRESVKVEVCKTILSSFIRWVGLLMWVELICAIVHSFQTEETSDPIIINAMMYVCKILHDSFK